jgi:RNA polymerase primary sigma factor
MDQEPQQSQIKQLIAKGKEQGFLTYAEVNDHLPDEIVEPEQIEDIIRMINDMGISVHETAPDADEQVMSDAASTDDDAAEAAAAALASVDSEFGRTTDPVRMYMREMGTVELLTREGELKIAKRIEDGLNQVLAALSTFPNSTAYILDTFSRVENGEIRLTEVISGFRETEEEEQQKAQAVNNSNTANDSDDSEEEEEEVDTGPDPEETAKHVATLTTEYAIWIELLDSKGKADPDTEAQRKKVSDLFLELKFLPSTFNNLVELLRNTIERIRSQERMIMICASTRAA